MGNKPFCFELSIIKEGFQKETADPWDAPTWLAHQSHQHHCINLLCIAIQFLSSPSLGIYAQMFPISSVPHTLNPQRNQKLPEVNILSVPVPPPPPPLLLTSYSHVSLRVQETWVFPAI